mgnify:CR=1
MTTYEPGGGNDPHDIWAPGEEEMGKWLLIAFLALIAVAVIGTDFFNR